MKTIRKSNILGIGYFCLPQVQGAPPLKGQAPYDYQDTTVFGEGSIQHDRAARFTGKPYDKEMGAYIFPYRNYDPTTMRWRSADPSGYPDGINNQFYAGNPTIGFDLMGTSWTNIDFVYHFYYGNGTSVNLNNIGLESKIKQSITDKDVYSDLDYYIANDMINLAPTTGIYSNLKSSGYNFGDVIYSINGATLTASITGYLEAGSENEDGTINYTYSANAQITFSDSFTDPVSILEYIYGTSNPSNAPDWLYNAAQLGGIPYDITSDALFDYLFTGSFEK